MSNESRLTREAPRRPEFPGNSETKDSESSKERIRPIVKGRVIKKGWGTKFKEAVISTDNPSIMDYLFYDILVPAAKETISNIISGGIELLLFGEKRHRPENVRRDGSKSYVSYGSYYNGNDEPSKRQEFRHAKDRHSFDDVIFNSRGEAEDVLSKMSELIEEYGIVSVADFYDLCNISSSFTDNRYGWNSFKEAFTERTRDGYIIRLPRTKPLN